MVEKKQIGMTLLETLIALAIFSIVLWAAVANYSLAMNTFWGSRLYSDIHAIRFAVIELHQGKLNYGTQSINTPLVASKKVPLSVFIKDQSLSSMDGIKMDVIGYGEAFAIELTGASKATCNYLMSRMSGANWSGAVISSSSVLLIPATSMPLSGQNLLNACSSNVMQMKFEAR
jgi:prepilin-type N-terminal cleavage/methylation domain-containing protein